jgi:hypothetical protein
MDPKRYFHRAASWLLGAWAALSAVVFPLAADAQPANQTGFSQQGRDFLVSALFDDAETWHSGGGSLIPWQRYARRIPPAREVDATDLAQDYRADAAAAERRYKEQYIGVRGSVVAAGEDGVGLYLQIGSPDRPVRAYIGEETVDEAAGYQTGQSVTLACYGASGHSPVLLNCQSANAKPFVKWDEVQRPVEAWLHGERLPGFIGDAEDGLLRVLFDVYWMGANLPPGSPCIRQRIISGCESEVEKQQTALRGGEAARYQGDYEASRQWLGLPAFVAPSAPIGPVK